VKHFATANFWFHYRSLTAETRELADRCFALLHADPRHPLLRLKKVGISDAAPRQLARECACFSRRSGGRITMLHAAPLNHIQCRSHAT
jgi:hypothetical protein